MKFPRSRPAVVCACYVCLHIAAQLSARLFEIAPGISVWYPPCGLAVALLAMVGPSYAPVVFLANVAGALVVPGFHRWWAPGIFPALITVNYTVAAYVLRRYIGRQLVPSTASQSLTFAGILALAPVGVAVGGTLLMTWFTDMPPPSFLAAVGQWWLGDFCGLVTVVPVIFVFVAPWLEGSPHPAMHWRWEGSYLGPIAAQVLALLGSLWFVFSRESVLPYTTLYVCFLPLIWTCLRHGLPGATLATLVLIMGSLIGMHFSPDHSKSYLISFLFFGVTIVVLGLGLGSAVTRRNEAQAQLSASRARFDRVIEGARLGLWDWNVLSGEIAYNDRCAELLECPPDRLRATQDAWEGAIHPADRVRNTAAMNAHLDGSASLYECEYRIHTFDGRWRWIHSRGSVVRRTEGGSPLLVSGTHLDVTERKLTEQTAKRLLTIVETTTDFVLTIDAHGHVLYANVAMLRLLGLPHAARLIGMPFTSVFPPAAAEVLQTDVIPRTLSAGSWHGEMVITDANRRTLPVSFVAMVHRDADHEGTLLSFVMRDISASKEAEAANLEKERKILQVQKAESLSVLTGGIAHDFNNLLTAIFGNASLLREEFGLTDARHGPLAQIEIAASRAADLCRNMLAYAGRFHLTPTEVSLNALVEESRELIQAAISKKIRLETHLATALPPIKGCASQLQQVIINLALNGNEAIGDRAGTITFRTFAQNLTPQDAGRTPDVGTFTPGPHVVLEIADSGPGVTAEIRGKMFEPFFTTKPAGHGLGLSAVNGIVRAHAGVIEVDAAPGRGATFRIFLPALTTSAPVTDGLVPPPPARKESGLALIVDDEDMVRTVMARLIERLGFVAITARDGAEAVELFKQRHHELRFVLTDLTMPRMSGDEAMNEMRRIDSKVPVLMMSGYPEKMTADHFALASPAALLVKPVRLQLLQKTLNQVLANTSPATTAPLSG